MSALLITTAISQVEAALQTAVLEALGKRITAATIAALRLVASAGMKHDALAFVTSVGYAYRFNRFSTAVDNGSSVIKPTDDPTAGRWLVTTSTAASGYLRDVKLYEGEVTEEAAMTWLFGSVPSVLIVWDGEEYEPRSQIPGALYRYRPRFSIWAVSRNLRGEQQGATGSQLSSEATADPGVNRIVGDLRSTLAGSDLSQDGIDWVEIVRAGRVLSSKTRERGHVYKLDVEVRATIHNPNAVTDLAAVRLVDVQRRLADLHGQDEYDGDNYIIAGLGIDALVSGLTQTITAGSAKVGGTTATFAGGSRLFVASKDTYRDLVAAGTFTYVAVANGAEEPAVTASALRVGKTVTNATDVISDTLTAATVEDFGSIDQVPPT